MIDFPRDATQLHSGAPWWLVANGLMEYPAVARTECDIAIIGTGITGALVADALTEAGADVMLIDRRAPGAGSTAVSTALLQYEIDVHLTDLIAMRGRDAAQRAYRLSSDAVEQLGAIVRSVDDDCGYAVRPSLYLASRRRDARRIEDECREREAIGLDIALWTKSQVEEQYGFDSHGALRVSNAAVVDPLRLTRALLDRCLARGAGLLTRTTVEDIASRNGGVLLRTDRGDVHARQVVLATGYEVPKALKRRGLIKLKSTFAFVTEPLDDLGPLSDGCLLWESARPYTYLRTTSDRRILIGGEDAPFKHTGLRDRVLPGAVTKLEGHLARLVPSLRPVREFAWAGTFAETKDGLPIIGPVKGVKGAWCALGYGGNGITFGVMAAQLLADLCLGKTNPDAELFRPDR